MKKFKFVIIGIVCIILICGGFYISLQKNVIAEKKLNDKELTKIEKFIDNVFFSKNSTNENNLEEIEKLVMKDLEKNYPKTPREVVKFFNRIIACYYGGEIETAEIEKLADQMLLLLDEELLLANPREEYIDSIKSDIRDYKRAKRQVVSTDVCDSNEVKYVDDVKEGTSEVDKIAYVNANYFVNTDGKFTYTYQEFVLRKDDKGRWKILAFYEVEGDPSDND